MKIAAVVTLFNPEREALENISSYCDFAKKIYVFDNTEQGASIRPVLEKNAQITYYHDGQNEGIAKRLNKAAGLAIKDGFEWLLLMDQDSSFTKAMISDYEKCLKAFEPKEDVGMLGVNFERNSESGNSDCAPIFSDDLITSGTLLNLALFPLIGNFDEALFIDGVDHDYSIKTLLAGYKMIQFKNVKLTHTIGSLVTKASIKTFYLVKKEKIVHSPLRCYYIYRNNLYLQKKYSGVNQEILKRLKKTSIAAIERSFFYGRNFWSMLYYIIAAKRDFKNKRMGKFAKK